MLAATFPARSLLVLASLGLLAGLLPACPLGSSGAPRLAPPSDAGPAKRSGADAAGAPAGAGCSRAPTVQPLAWAEQAVFYEIFVRSFQDSDGDGIGDLDGLRSRLDYLQDLGVTGLWLTPIFRSPSYHGYDTVDYEQVDPAYGGNEALQRLLAAAHQRGMRVILDLVLNHTSNKHPWFTAALDPASPKRSWYVWQQRPPVPSWTQPWSAQPVWHDGGGKGWYYGLFWAGMPDLNYLEPAVRSEMKRIARLWLDRGADGYRLDAIRYLVETGGGDGQADTPPTHAYLHELAQELRGAHPETLLVGEIWTDLDRVAPYFGKASGDELTMAFDFDLAGALLNDAASGRPDSFPGVLCRVTKSYPSHAQDAVFLSNHDQVRVATQLGGNSDTARLAAGLLLTLPGTPFLYYGEEIGMTNGREDGDPAKRTPMQWTGGPQAGFTKGKPWEPVNDDMTTVNVEAERADPGSLLSSYKALIALRRSSTALSRGDFSPLPVRCAGDGCYAFVRHAGDSVALVVANLGRSEEREVTIEAPTAPTGPGVPLQLLYPLQPATATTPAGLQLIPGKQLQIGALGPRQLRVFGTSP